MERKLFFSVCYPNIIQLAPNAILRKVYMYATAYKVSSYYLNPNSSYRVETIFSNCDLEPTGTKFNPNQDFMVDTH